jgi:hypothetical protein
VSRSAHPTVPGPETLQIPVPPRAGRIMALRRATAT